MSQQNPAQARSAKRIVLVTGTGRSGTSMMAGTLETLGLHVPTPVRKPDASNPRGFFETRWIVDFHSRILDRVHAHTNDGGPATVDKVRKAIGESTREELRVFIESATAEHDVLVVKDPRTVWFIQLWCRVAAASDVDVSFASMLRHPAEAVDSRTAAWGVTDKPERVRNRQVANLAGWVNVTLLNEWRTRGRDRVFVRYDDLLTDWRETMRGVGSRLELSFDAAPIDQSPHPVDEFIDPGLHRVQTSWDGLDVPPALSEIAERTWRAMQALVEPRTATEDAPRAQLGELRREYDALHADSRAITLDATRAAVARAVRRTEKRLTSATPPVSGEGATGDGSATAGSTASTGDPVRR